MTEKRFLEAAAPADTGIADRLRLVFETVRQVKERFEIARDVTVVAASKTVPAETILYAASLSIGLTDVGENRVQELLEKYDTVSRVLRMHMIGRLQTNKVKYILDKVTLIHSVDTLRLCEEIDRRAAQIGKVQDILVEINIGREADKGGVMPENTEEFLTHMADYPHIRAAGIMTVGPHCERKEAYRPYFEETARIYREVYGKIIPQTGPTYLSMGMSDNYDLAVECGANMIRPGSAIFGKRTYPNPSSQIQ